MKIVDLYTPFIQRLEQDGTPTADSIRRALEAGADGGALRKVAQGWDIDFAETAAWMAKPAYASRRELAREFIGRAPEVVSHVEGIFGMELPGEVWLAPSLEWFDGFARYDSGSHRVIFGVDFPDADEAYLRALMAHELSHVFRDHQPEVWAFLGKPLARITRKEYLDGASAQEHLVSEGLATLFSQHAYPEVPLRVHHYYEEDEMRWCLENHGRIDQALRECLRGDENVWSFYGEGRAGPGSPSRTQYFWAARVIKHWLEGLSPGNYSRTLIEAHGWAATRFECLAR